MPEPIVQTLGDSLRELAAIVDTVPSLVAAMKYPDVPTSVHTGVRTGSAVSGFAELLHRPVEIHHPADRDEVHTFLRFPVGRVELVIYAIEPVERELRRPMSAAEPHEALEPAVEVPGE